MGAVRLEIYKKTNKFARAGAGEIASGTPLQVATETSSTTATVAGSRITVTGLGGGGTGYASIVVDEDCYVSIGADPTAAATTSFLLKSGVARELPVSQGEKFSFKDVA